MNETDIVFGFVALSLSIAALWHFLAKSYFLASFGAAITTTIIWQVLAYLEAGFLDPFFQIASVVSLGVTVVISLIVGLPFILWRKKQKPSVHH